MAQQYNPYLYGAMGQFNPLMGGGEPVEPPPGSLKTSYPSPSGVGTWVWDGTQYTLDTDSSKHMTPQQMTVYLASWGAEVNNPNPATTPTPFGGYTGNISPYSSLNPYMTPSGLMPGIVMGAQGLNPSLYMSGGHTGEDKSFSRYLRQITGRAGGEEHGEPAIDDARRQKMLRDFWKMPIAKKMRVFMALRSSGGLYRNIGSSVGQQIPTYGSGVISWRT